MTRRPTAHLVLSDGTTFEGEAAAALLDGAVIQGEAVFNTALSGYQEVITDPSYAGQVVAFTYPQIGNYGVNEGDTESTSLHLEGVSVRDLPPLHSNFRATGGLEDYLRDAGVGAITGIDTRRLTRHLRDTGAVPCGRPRPRDQADDRGAPGALRHRDDRAFVDLGSRDSLAGSRWDLPVERAW